MAETRIILDTNAYFRLAQSIRPLLNTAFGKQNYTLYVLKELQVEYEKNPRLTNRLRGSMTPNMSATGAIALR